MAQTTDDLRLYLLSLVEQEQKRSLDWPNEWRPNEVIDPITGQPFTNESAWEFIESLLGVKGVTITRRQQNKPVGAVAYEMIYCFPDKSSVYIKIRPGKKHCILGRSFHYSEG